jgi:hypothetical protein
VLLALVASWGSIGVPKVAADSYPNTTYVSYVAPISDWSGSHEGEVVELSILNKADDSPFIRIDLAFTFPFFGVNLDRVFVNPNGALHKSSAIVCSGFFATDTCSLHDDTYYGLIAGLLADLYPFNSSLSNITYRADSDQLFVNFSSVPMFGLPSTLTNSFSFELGSDGRIIIRYYDVYAPTNTTGVDREWITGLRIQSDAADTHTVFSSEQLSISANIWSSEVKGIYPSNKSYVASGNQFVVCPISTSWCVTPKSLEFTWARNVFLKSTDWIVNITTMSISCTSYLEYGVQVVSSATVTSSTSAVACSQRGSSSGGYVTLTCNITTPVSEIIDSSSTISLLEVQLYIVSKVFAGNSVLVANNEFTAVDTIEPLILSIVNATNLTALSVSAQSNRCSTNSAIFSNQTQCDLCDRSVNNTNICGSNDPRSSSWYSYPNCPDISSNCSQSLFYDSSNNECCDVSAIDCFGFCNGTSVITTSSSGATVCCQESSLDCLGVCYGSSSYDACGVCNGIITSEIDCDDGDTGLQAGAVWPMFTRNGHHVAASPFQSVTKFAYESPIEADTIWSLDICNETYSSPVIDNQGTVYIGCENGYMFAVVENPTKESGTPVIRGKFRADGPIRTTAALDDNNYLHFGASNSVNFTLWAIDAGTFKTVWSQSFESEAKASFVPPVFYSECVYVVTVASNGTCSLHSLFRINGTLQWSMTLYSGLGSVFVSSSPMISSGLVYVHYYAVKSEVYYSSIEVVRLSSGAVVTSIPLSTSPDSQPSFNFSATTATVASPVLLPDKSVIAVSVDGTVTRFAIDPSTVTDTEPSINYYFTTPLSLIVQATPVLYAALDMYVVCSFNGTVVAVDMDSGSVVWKTSLASDGVIVTITSTAAVSATAGILMVPTSAALYAINCSSGSVIYKSTPAATATAALNSLWIALSSESVYNDGISNAVIAADGSVVYAAFGTGTLYRVGGSSSTCPSGYGVSSSLNATELPTSFSADNGLCTSCDTGYHALSSTCSPCSPGYFSNVTGMASCLSCSAGSYQGAYANDDCGVCGRGSYSDVGAGSCTQCAAGSYAAEEDTAYGCPNCAVGKFQESTGSTTCSLCAQGLTTSAVGASTCDLSCKVGYYGYIENSTALGSACALCPINTYTSTEAATQCKSCPAGYFTLYEGSSSCTGCEAGKYYDSDNSECKYCRWPYFPKDSADTGCSYYLLVPVNDRIGFAVNLGFVLMFGLTVFILVMSVETELTEAELAAGFVITRAGFAISMLPCWLEQFLQMLYVLNVPFTNAKAFASFVIMRFFYQYVATAVMVGGISGYSQLLTSLCSSLHTFRLILIGGGLFLLKGFAIRTVYNNFIRGVTGHRQRDYCVSPIVVEFVNVSNFIGFFLQTIPLLILILVASAPTQFWYQDIIFVLYLLAAVYSALPIFYHVFKGCAADTYTIATMPLHIRFGGYTWLFVHGDTDGLSRARHIPTGNGPVRARPVAINDFSYANAPVAPVSIVDNDSDGDGENVYYCSNSEVNGTGRTQQRHCVEIELVSTGHDNGTPDESPALDESEVEYDIDGGGEDGNTTVISSNRPTEAVARSISLSPAAVSPSSSSAVAAPYTPGRSASRSSGTVFVAEEVPHFI